ncbi:hypothetical protein ACFSQU_11875 [Massilia sp. GCM10020059]|uniref:Uncharacterized protein n=1 Tax=Massilia agrisoli TaxID=2892444 RepID=A0ABS8IQ40_9BURK|nr:hypothetical protein [Massilia agrisoli]MCC6070521.1 hypothetical protein [Massilia agrisoli]
MTDEEFLASFNACTLPPEQFSHAGHIRLAWINLQRHDFDQAVDGTCRGIRAYATHLGAATKFHTTITVALMHLLRAAGAGDRNVSWYQFVSANQELMHNARAVLGRHYSSQRLDTPEARERFVAPDLQPLPV